MNKRRPLKNLAKIALFLATFSTSASASDFRLGVALGIGGAGIDKIVAVNGVDTTVHRSEGPGTFTLFLDYLLSERISVAFEHSRGLRLGPFSSGVSFTGIATRIFLTPAPSVTREPPIETYVLIKKFTFFGGFSMGLASGDIQREADVVPSVQSSAVYLGVKVGADFPLSTGWVLRPEISYATSPVASTISPAALTELSVQCGIYLSL